MYRVTRQSAAEHSPLGKIFFLHFSDHYILQLPLEGGCRGEKHPADEIAWIIGNACGAALFRQVDVFGRAPLHYAVLHKKVNLPISREQMLIAAVSGRHLHQTRLSYQHARQKWTDSPYDGYQPEPRKNRLSSPQCRRLLQRSVSYLTLSSYRTEFRYFADDHSECSRLVKSHEQRVELALQIDNGQA